MKKGLLSLLFTISVLLGIYVGFSVYFKTHYFFNTSINNIKCERKDPAYVIKKSNSQTEDYLLTITDISNNRFHIRGIDIGYKYVPAGEEEVILKSQNPWLWPKSLWTKSKYKLPTSVTYNEDLYQEIFEDMGFFDESYVEKPKDAYISLTTDGYEVIPEVLGNELKPDLVNEMIKEALSSQATELTLDEDCYKKPEIYLTNPKIIDTAENLEFYLRSSIHYLIEGEDVNFTRKDIMKMISLDSDGNVVIDRNGADNFAQQLASKYNTYADERLFTTSLGDTIKIAGGDYGWVIDKNSEAKQILADLEGGAPVEREPIYSQRANKSGLNDIGRTYIEIDYSNQHLWYYDNGKLTCETDIVSGNINKDNGSVDGVFKISYKQKDAILRGEDYESAVKYFMPFAYNIGIHDASWRNNFGGEIYKSSGSHGCINVPFQAAEELFQIVPTGTPVIAYYREPVVLTNNAAKMSNAFSYKK